MIIFTVINLSLWGIFLIKFKKIFSTDSIIEKTKKQIDLIINDMDQNTDRDISLLNETMRKIKNFVNESDKQIESFKEASNRLKDLIAEADKKIKINSNSLFYENQSVERQVKNQTKYKGTYSSSRAKSTVNPDATYQVTSNENDLFSDNKKSIFNDEITVTEEGAAYKQVPLIITKVLDEKSGDTTKNKNKEVKKLYEQGYTVEQIAIELSCSIIEVQFIIDML
ncbi:MAG: hypothetical protein GX677_04475 [Treponema sp.]|nr:hypothetical protein [Treponema sp.]